MDINYELYKVFYYVATTLSFSEASKLLFISQSAVSQSIKVLEKKLGITLFIRSTKRVQLTPEGETLLRHVEPAINLIARGEAQIMEAGTLGGGQLRIGASDTICRYFLVPYLNRFHRSFPNVHIKVTNQTSTQCVDLLESAGAAKAEVLINAIDDPQASMEMVELVKEHFPNLTIIARARDVDHYIRLRQAGVDMPERETFEGALKTGRLALEGLGLGRYEARERADVFRRFNMLMVEEMVKGENDAISRAAVYKRTSAMLSEIIAEDRQHLSLIQRHGWQGTDEGKHTGDVADEPEVKPSA